MYHGVSNNKIQYPGKWKYAIDTREDREMSGHQNSGIHDKLNSEFFGLCFTAATSCNMYCDTNKECNSSWYC